jgi:hypothetical protein
MVEALKPEAPKRLALIAIERTIKNNEELLASCKVLREWLIAHPEMDAHVAKAFGIVG